MNEQLRRIIDQLERRTSLSALSPTHIWNSTLDSEISELQLTKPAKDKRVIALMAGLHLWNDSLDRSHSYSQEIEDDQTGSYWHGIMHRMEQDYWNSKYWFRRAGNHPVKHTIQAQVANFLSEQAQMNSLISNRIVNRLKKFRDQQDWCSDDFVDLVEHQENGNGIEETRQLLEQIQQIELKQLFNYTYKSMLND